jgi:hypothetical protein
VSPTQVFLPAQITDGDEVVQVGSGQNYTCSSSGGSITVTNTNGTYNETSSVDFELPDTTLEIYVDGELEETITFVTLDPDAVITIEP